MTTTENSAAPTAREIEEARIRDGRALADQLEADLGIDLDALAADDVARRNYEETLESVGIFTTREEARSFVSHLLSAVHHGTMPEALARWVRDTREILEKLAELRDKRDAMRALAVRRERLEENVRNASRILQYERDRLALYPAVEDFDGAMAAHYLAHVAGTDVPINLSAFVTTWRGDADFRRLLETRVIPELERRLKAAEDALAGFMASDGAALLA